MAVADIFSRVMLSGQLHNSKLTGREPALPSQNIPVGNVLPGRDGVSTPQSRKQWKPSPSYWEEVDDFITFRRALLTAPTRLALEGTTLVDLGYIRPGVPVESWVPEADLLREIK